MDKKPLTNVDIISNYDVTLQRKILGHHLEFIQLLNILEQKKIITDIDISEIIQVYGDFMKKEKDFD
jgi:hypothetical protein